VAAIPGAVASVVELAWGVVAWEPFGLQAMAAQEARLVDMHLVGSLSASEKRKRNCHYLCNLFANQSVQILQ
jgi:hypothetical protein